MDIERAQADVRRTYRAGFSGPLVSSLVWFAAAATYQWSSPSTAMAVLFLGGVLIFPLSTVVLKFMGGPAALPKGHPSASLAMQSAFTVPLGLLVAIALGSYEPELFFPAALIIVGAHYLVFVSLYGMRLYAVAAAVLAGGGTVTLLWLPDLGGIAGWAGGAALLFFAFVLHLADRTRAEHEGKRPIPVGGGGRTDPSAAR